MRNRLNGIELHAQKHALNGMENETDSHEANSGGKQKGEVLSKAEHRARVEENLREIMNKNAAFSRW